MTYRVTADFADTIAAATYGYLSDGTTACSPSTAPSSASFALCSTGNITINTRNTTTKTSTVLASNVVAIVISHGKNGYGANLPSGTSMPNPPAINVDETTNKSGGASFISREISDQSDSCSDTATGSPFCEFDDIVTWIPFTTLLSKTVAAGKLP